ncbi:MAG TPA: nicotinate dehydrogenase medium molybdopterin subunit, partial [Myxococcales bacterium]|nr:nicotinate dehydrogenase medium molybdopterin subunit [Myxococcales bacterium]
FGYKSLGASPLLAIPPAIINAITHAIGVPIDSLPVTPEALYELLSADKRYSD